MGETFDNWKRWMRHRSISVYDLTQAAYADMQDNLSGLSNEILEEATEQNYDAALRRTQRIARILRRVQRYSTEAKDWH